MKLKIISDGTNTGTYLIDEDTGNVVERISKLTWAANVQDMSTTITVELTDIPVEIVAPAEVILFGYETDLMRKSKDPSSPLILGKIDEFQKDVKIVSERREAGSVPFTQIFDKDSGKMVGAIQNIKWECTLDKCQATVEKIKFDKKDWV